MFGNDVVKHPLLKTSANILLSLLSKDARQQAQRIEYGGVSLYLFHKTLQPEELSLFHDPSLVEYHHCSIDNCELSDDMSLNIISHIDKRPHRLASVNEFSLRVCE